MNILTFCFSMVPITVAFASLHDDTPAKQPDKTEVRSRLDTSEEAAIRHIVYTQDLGTSITESPGYRVLAMPKDIAMLHKTKREAVLRLLLDLVKGGRPVDSLRAAAYAIALEESPVAAAVCANYPLDEFDEDPLHVGHTPRSWFVDRVQEHLDKTKKQ